MAIISCEGVTKGYQKGMPILKDVSFTLESGTFHFLSGPSGAGKTTLLSLLALIQRPDTGHIRMFGQDATQLPREALPKMRRRIGVVSQDYKLLSHLTVEQNVGLPLKVCGEPDHVINSRVTEMLDWVGLKDYHKARPEVLSGGQKQRVAIARAVITRPDVLLCDEPSGNLDLELSLRFMYLFQALHKMGTTVLFATHDDYLITKFPYPVMKLKEGIVTVEQAEQPGLFAHASSA